MTPWTAPAPYEIDSWLDLEDHLARCSRAMTVVVGRDGPVVTLDVWGCSGGRLRVTDPRDRLRAQDRRRLHRLGLRPDPGEDCWAWESSPPPPSERGPALLRARLQAWSDVQDACRAQLVAVLREGLRLEPAQLTVLPLEDEDEDDEDEDEDEAWDSSWDESG